MYGDILNTNNYVTLAQYYLSPKHQTHVTLYIVKYIYMYNVAQLVLHIRIKKFFSSYYQYR